MTTNSTQPAPAAAAPTHTVGMSQVLEHPRTAADVVRPPVVEFRNVTKTYGAGGPKPYTAIKEVTFVVEDLPKQGRVCLRTGAERLREEHDPAADCRFGAAASADERHGARPGCAGRGAGGGPGHGVSGLHQL
jgi:hypothetical protein